MKIRILSDMHLDVNSGNSITIKDKDVFTILAGDTSGDPQISHKWLSKNIHRGIIISGNHLVYNKRGKTIQELRDEMSELFPIDGNLSYLDSECGHMSKVVDGILFIGTTLYTDYKYNTYKISKEDESYTQSLNMGNSARMMNDFRWGHVDDITRLSPENYLFWFNKSFAMMEKIVEDNENSENPLPVVIVTHHCMSPKCISSEYLDSRSNASYISDLEWFIKKHKSIKCVVSGHVHHQDTFTIDREDGSKCLYVMNPRGYCCRCEDIPDFNENTFVDTDTWTVEKTEKSQSRKNREKKRLVDFLGKYSMFF